MTNNELYHFGVKGMKWGVRRNRSSFVSTSGPKRLLGTYASDGNGWTAKAKRLPGAIVKKDGYDKSRMPKRVASLTSQKSGKFKQKAAANTPEAKAREKRLKKAALYGAAAAAKTVSKLAQIGTKFDKNPAGRLAREAIRSDKIAVGADIAIGILQAGYGAVAVKSIYEIGKTYSGNEQRSNSK